jgi:hypothetical protein
MSDWIPFRIEDADPPSDRWLLICVQPRVGPRDVNIGTWDTYRKQWRSRLGFKVHGTVTHWMELPEAPGE